MKHGNEKHWVKVKVRKGRKRRETGRSFKLNKIMRNGTLKIFCYLKQWNETLKD